MTSKRTKTTRNMSTGYATEYQAVFYNRSTGIYTAEITFPDGSELTLDFESYEQWERTQANLNTPSMRYLYANG